jgi:hypothetical protein
MSRDTSKFLIMGSLFAGTLGFIAILTILIASVIGALILWLLAKTVGKISNANFLNSWMVVLASSGVYAVIIYLIGVNLLSMGLGASLIINALLSSAAYIIFGKLIWKCSWMESFKANIILIAINLAYSAYTASLFS